MPGRKFSSGLYRYGFGGHEKSNEIYGEGNALDFGARIQDSRLARFLSTDPLQKSYPSITPYNFVTNSPLIVVDLDGRDFVFFNMKGEEIFRIRDDKQFRTFVQTGNFTLSNILQNKVFSEAPMPKIIKSKGAEDKTTPINQQYDYIIAAETFILNTEKNAGILPLRGKGNNKLTIKSSTIPDLDPTLVKATIMQESDMGLGKSKKNNDVSTDIMQANVCYDPSQPSNPKLCDWSPDKKGNSYKEQFGLTLGGGTISPQQSIKAGIRIMLLKGISSDGKGNDTWTGGSLWEKASKSYNGGGAENYDRVQTMQKEALPPKPENYVTQPKNKEAAN